MAIILTLFLASCAGGTPVDYLRIHDISPPSLQHFTHCHSYGCQKKVEVNLPAKTKRKLIKNFTPAAKSAEEERAQIARAIGIFETDIGAITGTHSDKYGTFRIYKDENVNPADLQQDCVDESTNTTTYLMLLNQMEMLHFHRPAFPTSRQPFWGGNTWWHQSAVIEEIDTAQRFTVDSWFEDNGHPAYVIPLEEWSSGWNPLSPE
ncbi:MAG: hypothetical protein MRY79_06685 [Alphaproteobacteria bacterium]|nr:hypothetical protein [Alphaproteobacteria bacterium]